MSSGGLLLHPDRWHRKGSPEGLLGAGGSSPTAGLSMVVVHYGQHRLTAPVGGSFPSFSLPWSVPSRGGLTAAVVRRSVAGVGGARHPAIFRERRRGQPDRLEGRVGLGGCHRRWSRGLQGAHQRRERVRGGRGGALW